jgi:hypothetical protein
MSSTSANSKLGEYFVRLPKLTSDGSNYIIYKNKLLFAVQGAGLSKYIDEKEIPKPPQVADAEKPTDSEKKALEVYQTMLSEWEPNEAIIKQGIAATIPDSLFLKVMGEKTAAGMWKRVKEEYERKSQMLQVDLRRKLQDKRCGEGDNVKTHLDDLQKIREDLIAIGADPGDDNFSAILLGSLPTSYDPYIAALTAASTLLNQKLAPDVYLRGIRDEADRRSLRKPSGKGKDSVAFTAREQQKDKRNVECFNCHKKGHMKRDCWAKGGEKEGQGPKGKGRVNGRGKGGGTGESNSAEGKDADELWVVERRKEDDEDWEQTVEINLGGWWTPEDRIEKGLEGMLSLYIHDPILWDGQSKDDKTRSQGTPFDLEINPDPTTPTNSKPSSTQFPSPATEDLELIFDESDGPHDEESMSLVEENIADHEYESNLEISPLQEVSDSESEDEWPEEGISDANSD